MTTSNGPWAGLTSGDFTIDGGVLAFKSRPQTTRTRSQDSIGTRADRNVYNVTVQATGGSHDCGRDGRQRGRGRLGELRRIGPGPAAGRQEPRGHAGSDPDMGETDEVWQWARSMDMQTWTDIEGATAQKRSPTADDEGYYLRASVTYTRRIRSGQARVQGDAQQGRGEDGLQRSPLVRRPGRHVGRS